MVKEFKFKTKLLLSSLCDYINAYIPVTGTISVVNIAFAAAAAAANNSNRKMIFNNCVPFK